MSYSEWFETTLGDVVTFQRGHDLPRTKMVDGPYHVVASNGVIGNHAEFTCEGPTITIGRSGNVGSPLYWANKIWAHNTTLYVKEFKDVELEFMYYFLKTLNLSHYAGGSAVPTLNRNHIHSVPIKIPKSKKSQIQIAKILSTFDQKIELNNKMNKNLEKMAQAIFKQWFVDFEFPNEQGEPYKSSGGKMVWCEVLGKEIPEGWGIRELKSLSELITKGTTPTTTGQAFTDKGINFIKAESITEKHSFDMKKFSYIEEETHQKLKRSILQEGDILFTIAGSLGRFAMVSSDILPANTNQAISIIRINENLISKYYIYTYLLTDIHKSFYTERIQQAVQANLSLSTIGELPIIVPTTSVMKRFLNHNINKLKIIEINNKSNVKLSEIRDTLLPKLMSGEIDVSNIEL